MAVLDSPRAGAGERSLGHGARIPAIGTVVASVMVAGAALMPVVQSTIATTTGYETQKLEQRRNDLQAAIYQEQTEIAQLGSTDRIDGEARERLGMVPATDGIVVPVSRPPGPRSDVPARFLPLEEQAQPAPV